MVRVRGLSGRDWMNAGTLSEILFLMLMMINNLWRPSNTNLLVAGAVFAFAGLVFMGHGYGGIANGS